MLIFFSTHLQHQVASQHGGPLSIFMLQICSNKAIDEVRGRSNSGPMKMCGIVVVLLEERIEDENDDVASFDVAY
ncbi:hypothetical protein DEO72_LG3g633 [Vigna unguiculata]|uniref:Uncharacterized protein n=1 Tax=Vigna unguiculata TaxID=3917 RepID=A0A4D6LC11_VIGUN|nr:hypothetical protein DEO72_LG3g633 [Vigna unguiculata]